MNFPLLLRQRLKTLGTEQRDLAAAAQVTESYISQLVTGKKRPPAPERTDIYDRMEKFLRVPAGELARLAELERREAVKRILAEPPTPLLTSVRELIVRKCVPAKRASVRAIFEREPFGALEHLVIQKLLDVVKNVAREELADDQWLRRVARLGRCNDTQMRVIVLDFLEAEALSISADHCVAFLDPLIESWDIDLNTFGMEIVLNRRLASAHSKRFEFVERDDTPPVAEEPGFRQFLTDPTLSAGITANELAFLKKLAFTGNRPTALYYYRELQSLRDPLHFSVAGALPDQTTDPNAEFHGAARGAPTMTAPTDRARRKSAAQANRIRDVKRRAKEAAKKKRKRARARTTMSKAPSKTPPA